MIELTKKIISFRSDGNEVVCMDFLYDYITNLYGDKVAIEKQTIWDADRYNLIVQTSTDPKLLLAWHLDTVPLAEISQINPVIKGNRLYGRWAVDMKSWVAIIIDILPYLLEKNIPSMLLFYCDEEYNFLWMKSFVQKYTWKTQPILTIIPEATNGKIVTWFRWIAEYDISIKWKSAHAARADQWINAIDAMLWLKQHLYEKLISWDTDWFNSAINIGGIIWWSSIQWDIKRKWNVVADTAKAVFDIRLWWEIQQALFELWIEQYSSDNGIVIELMTCNFWLPSLSQKNISNRYTKFAEIDDGGTFWYSDIQMIQQYIGGDCILVWPSPNQKSHKDDEYVQIDSIYRARKTIEKIIDDVMQIPL